MRETKHIRGLGGYSYDTGKGKIKKWFLENFKEGTSILDIGPGEGTYYKLLKDTYLKDNMDCVEACEEGAIKWELDKMYNNVFIMNALDLKFDHYDLIIMGDVLEHLSVEDAQKFLDYALPRCNDIMVAVPYELPQGPLKNNEYEIHIQGDLTPELMEERYPQLEPILVYKSYGYYHKKLNK